MKPKRIIDFHQHVFWHGRDDAGLVANLDEHGIDKAVVLTWEVGEQEAGPASYYENVFNPVHAQPGRNHPGLPLADAVAAVRRHPDRFILGYCPHPAWPTAIGRLESAIRMHRVRVCGEWKFRILLDDPACVELFRFCGRQKLPVVVHIDVPWRPEGEPDNVVYCKEWYGGTVDNLARAMDACPETVFLGHGPGFWREVSGDAAREVGAYPAGPVAKGGKLLEVLDAYPRLHGDLSANSCLNALKRDPKFGRAFLLKYHRRLLFARDDYNGNLHAHLQSLRLPRNVLENIRRRNAERLLGM